MNDYLPEILRSIDERFLAYLDGDGEMLPETVRRLGLYTNALLGGSITPIAVAEDWEGYYHLLPCFTMVYAPEWVGDLEGPADFLIAFVTGEDSPLSEEDVRYLMAVEPVLDRYPVKGTPGE